MKRIRFAVLLAALVSLVMASSAMANTVSADSYITTSAPSTTHNCACLLRLDATASPQTSTSEVLLDFDTSGLSTTASTAALTVQVIDSSSTDQITVDEVNPFTASTVTWNNQPSNTFSGVFGPAQMPSRTQYNDNGNQPTNVIMYASTYNLKVQHGGSFPSHLYYRVRLSSGTTQATIVKGASTLVVY